jgi:hypothetical protein
MRALKKIFSTNHENDNKKVTMMMMIGMITMMMIRTYNDYDDDKGTKT